jgi:uncharacterized lipoprotein NlpE involved in copper resistance
MKKLTCALFLSAAVVLLTLGGCASKQEMAWYKSEGVTPADFHNSKISLSWEGIYTGTIPSANDSGINVLIVLNRDETFMLRHSYVGDPEKMFDKGTFKWDKYGEMITLDIKDWPPHYKPVQDKLYVLSADGKYITGDLEENYALKKIWP